MIAVDWGTSSFRAYRVGADGAIAEKRAAPLGILHVEGGAFAQALESQVGDWLAANLRWNGDKLLVVHDWDSVTADSESVLAGFAAALYSTVSMKQLATVEETQRFLVAYRDAHGRELSADELERSWAAGVWTRVT